MIFYSLTYVGVEIDDRAYSVSSNNLSNSNERHKTKPRAWQKNMADVRGATLLTDPNFAVSVVFHRRNDDVQDCRTRTLQQMIRITSNNLVKNLL